MGEARTPAGVSCSVLAIAARLDKLGVPLDADVDDVRISCVAIWGDDERYRPPPVSILRQVVEHRRPRRRIDLTKLPLCVNCQTPMIPIDGASTHPMCDVGIPSCVCPTPWDGKPRVSGVHCVGCHANFGSAEAFLAHRPYDDDGCVSLGNLRDVDGERPWCVYMEGGFRVWRRKPRTVGPRNVRNIKTGEAL